MNFVLIFGLVFAFIGTSDHESYSVNWWIMIIGLALISTYAEKMRRERNQMHRDLKALIDRMQEKEVI